MFSRKSHSSKAEVNQFHHVWQQLLHQGNSGLKDWSTIFKSRTLSTLTSPILSMVVSGSPIPLIYHLYIANWVDYMVPTTYSGNQETPLILGSIPKIWWSSRPFRRRSLGDEIGRGRNPSHGSSCRDNSTGPMDRVADRNSKPCWWHRRHYG